jgi:hypothetical protein
VTAANNQLPSSVDRGAPLLLVRDHAGEGVGWTRDDAVMLLWISLLSGLFLVARVCYILRVPDLDGDAYAHFAIGRAVLRVPRDLGPHWVWLPGYHFFLAGLQKLGARFVHVRILNAVLQTAGPLVLYRFARMRHTRTVALRAAVFWCVSSLPNMLGTSALGEVPFTLLVLGSTFAIDAGERDVRWSTLGGVLLTLACAMRYEASVAVAALGSTLLVGAMRARRVPWSRAPAFLLPATCIVAYVAWRRWCVDGEWLWFVRETLKFTTMQRDVLARSRMYEAFWFPLILPFKLVGPALFIAPLGAVVKVSPHKALRVGAAVPAAIAVFLVSVYAGNGILGLARYWSVLLPFTCLFVARAVAWLGGRLGRGYVRLLTAGVLASLAATSLIEVRAGARQAMSHEAELRAWETRINDG